MPGSLSSAIVLPWHSGVPARAPLRVSEAAKLRRRFGREISYLGAVVGMDRVSLLPLRGRRVLGASRLGLTVLRCDRHLARDGRRRSRGGIGCPTPGARLDAARVRGGGLLSDRILVRQTIRC